MISIYVFLCDNLRFNNIFELMGNCCGITPIKKLPKEALYQIRQICTCQSTQYQMKKSSFFISCIKILLIVLLRER